MRNLTAILCGMAMLGFSALVLAATDDATGSSSTEMQATDSSNMKTDDAMSNDSATTGSKKMTKGSKKAAEGRTTSKGLNLNKGKAENLPPEEGGRKN